MNGSGQLRILSGIRRSASGGLFLLRHGRYEEIVVPERIVYGAELRF